jgi:hypothetical protein
MARLADRLALGRHDDQAFLAWQCYQQSVPPTPTQPPPPADCSSNQNSDEPSMGARR